MLRSFDKNRTLIPLLLLAALGLMGTAKKQLAQQGNTPGLGAPVGSATAKELSAPPPANTIAVTAAPAAASAAATPVTPPKTNSSSPNTGAKPLPVASASAQSPPLAAPAGSAPLLNEMREKVWGAEEGIQGPTGPVISQWNGEKTDAGSFLSRTVNGVRESAIVGGADENMLREKVATLSIQLPKRPTQTEKNRCAHWLDIDTLYGRRYFCFGEDSEGAEALLKEFSRIFQTHGLSVTEMPDPGKSHGNP